MNPSFIFYPLDKPLEEKNLDFLSLLLTQGFGIIGENQQIINDVLAIRYLASNQEKFETFARLIPDERIKQKFLEEAKRLS